MSIYGEKLGITYILILQKDRKERGKFIFNVYKFKRIG